MQVLLEAGRGKEQSLPGSPRRSQPCSHLAFSPTKLSLDLRTPELWENKCASLCTTRFVVTVNYSHRKLLCLLRAGSGG